MSRYRGVCCDPGWGPGVVGSPDPALLADLGIRRVRIISRPNLEWYVEDCWRHHILVRAVVVDGHYCPADEWVVLNEPNLHGMPAHQFAQELQIHRNSYPDLKLIAGAIVDDPPGGFDGAQYMRAVRDSGGLNGYQGVSIHYPQSAARITAIGNYSAGLPIHVTEYHDDHPSEYIPRVLGPRVSTADLFCANSGMRDPGWTRDFGLFWDDWSPRPILRQWLSVA